MNKLRKVLRLAAFVLLILFACCGISFTGDYLSRNGERLTDNEIKTELVEKERQGEESRDVNELK
jgi:hypothetical protein